MTVETLNLEALLEEFASVLIDGRGFSPATAAAYCFAPRDYERRMSREVINATTREIDRYMTRMGIQKLAQGTRRTRLNALKAFFRFLQTRGHRDDDPAKVIEGPKDSQLEVPSVFEKRELAAMIFRPLKPPPIAKGRREPPKFFTRRALTSALIESRDTALLALMFSAGLRAGEVALLERRDYDEAKRTLHIRGAKWRTKPETKYVFHRPTEAALLVYLNLRDRSPWAEHPALFPPLFEHSGRAHPGVGISADGVTQILRKRIARAGIERKGRRLSPHALRYSLGTHLHNGGKGLTDTQIMVLLRHKSVATTQRYIRLGGSRSVEKRGADLLRDVGVGLDLPDSDNPE